jgi:hypothetical protein
MGSIFSCRGNSIWRKCYGVVSRQAARWFSSLSRRLSSYPYTSEPRKVCTGSLQDRGSTYTALPGSGDWWFCLQSCKNVCRILAYHRKDDSTLAWDKSSNLN